MLSICIPIYNNDCNKLVDDLNKQINMQDLPIEIICIDDKSNDNFRSINKTLKEKCSYVLLDENIGRARIRNKFLEYAKFDWLLFLDNDSCISTSDYLKKYIKKIQENAAMVISGGTHFLPPANLTYKNNLCFKICNAVEKNLESIRSINVYASFMTNNFVINKITFSNIKFDETLTKYGHEDTVFGLTLQTNTIPVVYIDNRVDCLANDSNKIFIEKTKQGIDNLLFLTKTKGEILIDNVALLSFYFKCKQKGLKIPLRIIGFLLLPLLQFLQMNGFANVIIYKLYKLLLLSKIDLD